MSDTQAKRWVAIALGVTVLCCASLLRARAGTTGFINGVVTDAQTRAPIAGARVEVTSPSQVASAVTDARGAYSFVSLSPDTYTVTVTKNGYLTTSVTDVTVFADATQVVNVSLRPVLKTIARARSIAASALVRSGTTSDLYSVNAAQQGRTAVLGGGGNLDSAYSAIGSVPGAYVPSNQQGYNEAVYIRGQDSGAEGFEYDGIPINRAFDNYPSGSISSLGQLELQVYTGASPADAEAQGLAGFINQVIKTGTYPGYASADFTAGTPAFYHSLNVEVGGATPDRMFSYYVGIGGFNQDHRYIDQFNGYSLANEFGPPLGTCPATPPLPPSCYTNGVPNVSAGEVPGYILGPMPFGLEAASVMDRSTVVNVHIGIPRKNGLRDDIQLLYDYDLIETPLYVSPNDELPINYNASTLGPPLYTDSFQYRGTPGSFFSDSNVPQVTPYLFPGSPSDRPLFAPLPLNGRDIQFNNQGIVKFQYEHTFSSNSYLRFYGYTYYSTYGGAGAASSWQNYVGFDSGDYELSSHTRGVSLSFVDQISDQHLLSVEGSFVTASSLRMNNYTMFNEFGFAGLTDNFAVLVNPNALNSGVCYSIYDSSGTQLAPGAAIPTSCGTGNVIPVALPATSASLYQTYYNGTPTSSFANPGDVSNASLSGYTCGSGPCKLYVAQNGYAGEYNTVTPKFTGLSVVDQWRPSDRILVNVGLRFDQYQYIGDNTTATPARAFWFNAFNLDTCFDTTTLTLADKSMLETGPFSATTPCSSFGSQYVAANMSNVPSQVFTYNILQPRFGATYTLNPDTVLRVSIGRYTEQPSAAYEQYDSLSQNLPETLLPFYALGFTTPGHAIGPPTSWNYDFSFEHHFPGTNVSMKLTPFLSQTYNQIENFYLNIKQGFISGFNAGQQTSDGVELALTAGDFASDGITAQLSFAYTYASLRFNRLPNGTTVLSPINADIATYNAYTRACAPGGVDVGKSQYGQPLCGATSTGVTAAPCYAGGIPDPTCSASNTVANPYWNAPGQPLMNPSASYLPYSVLPGGIGSGVNAYTFPYVATLLLQYKHGPFAILPSLQFVAGNRYGAPETTPGIDPASSSCTGLATGPSHDPRYPYGAPGGTAFDASTCAGSTITIPDPYTGQFDSLGAFREPAQLLGNLQISYVINPRVTATVTAANLLSTCFGGQQTGFTYFWSRNVCSYSNVEGGYVNPVGNAYNPGDNVQTVLRYPYAPSFGTYNDLTSSTLSPFNVYFDLKVTL
jgi:hypothetical protein